MSPKYLVNPSLKKSFIFTTGPYYGSKRIIALKYCYVNIDRKGILKWRTRVWAYWTRHSEKQVTAQVGRLKLNGLIYFPSVKQGQAVSEYQQGVLKKHDQLGPHQHQLRML